MDLPDDIFLESSIVGATARVKFKPKVKLQLKKKSSSTGPTKSAAGPKEQEPLPSAPENSDPSSLFQCNDFANKSLNLPYNTATETAGTEQTSLRVKASQLEHVFTDRNLSTEGVHIVDSATTGNLENTVSKASGDEHLSPEASLGSQGSKDIISQLTASAVEDRYGFPGATVTSPSPFRPCSAQGLSIPSTDQDFRQSDETFLGNAGELQMDIEQETVDFSFLEAGERMIEDATFSGNEAVKFLPKPNVQSMKKIISAEVSNLPEAGNVFSEKQPINGDDLIQASDIVTVSSPSHVRLYGEINESGNGYFDGVRDGSHLNSNSTAKALHELGANNVGIDDDYHLEEEISKKKRLQNSMEVSSENDKPIRKRKQANSPEDSTKKPRKKFPHATHRKRYVDKSLLEAPEAEIDLQTVSIRNLIVLSDYKERQTKKQAAVVQPSSTKERIDNTLIDDLDDEDEASGSDQDTGSIDDPSTSGVIEDTNYFNYRSFMDNKRRRWTKHETELFYQGIQEFGTDFSMIQQRYFPDRFRQHVKLKFKKEEREQPMRIHDALTSRAKDLSHFEVLIRKLQEHEQVFQEKDAHTGDDDLVCSILDDEGRDGEGHETQANSQEAAKSEENGINTALIQEGDDDATQVETSAQSNNSEDECDWSEYKSEL